MKAGRIHSWKKVTAQLVLLALPTIALVTYMLWDVNRYYHVLQNRFVEQGVFFATGIITAFVFYAFRFRFITTVALIGLFYYVVYKIIDSSSFGEFDSFFVSVRFLTFTFLFSAGWIAGYGLSRSKYFTISWSVFLLALQIIVISRTSEITVNAIIGAFAPVLAYSFFIIYTAELIRNMNEQEKGFAWFLTKRLAGFAGIAAIVLIALLLVFEKDFKAIEQDWGGAQGNNKGGQESMTRENRDGSISNKDQMQVTGSLSKDKQLVFVARLDHFFPDGKTPNPLYFTSRYYTRFDTLTQTFETDDNIPSNDLFSPDPSKIPLYFVQTDSSVLQNALASKARQVVTADVYKVALSPNEFLAPSTAFYCQPIAVEPDYKDQFKSAYKAKMWVSDLNSAYFIYNPGGNPFLEAFQQTRFQALRTAASYAGVEKTFMQYYTFMPANPDYHRITALAKEITKDAQTPVDKMIAIRDYFLSQDEYGQPLYRYSDNPGVPGLPSASKLNYFLFENRKGYCAYYAGATLFLLRSLGIPSRIAAGFLTVDRSNKNPGWYWFYADQAHAWVQVYFPGYGWIDFDTTIPDANTQQADQPDGTPPMQTQQALLVATGKATTIDTVAKTIALKVEKLLYHDKTFTTARPQDMMLDVSVATITRDTGNAAITDIKPGTEIVAVSFAEAYKNRPIQSNDDLASLVAKPPLPAPIDEVKIMETDKEKEERTAQQLQAEEPFNWWQAAWIALAVIAGFIVLLFSLPWLVWLYLHQRAKGKHTVKKKAFYQHYASLYYLHQMRYGTRQEGPAAYAAQIDRKMGSNFQAFHHIYQKIKYSTTPLTAGEEKTVYEFYPAFIKQVRQHIPARKRLVRFLDIYSALHFFTKAKNT